MTERFDICLPLVLKHEGGYVNHPKDPGGATNMGVTQRTYDAWRARSNMVRRSVSGISDEEVAAIYGTQYWDKVSADDLPAGVDYAVFDFAVNSGPARAAQFLQRIVGVEPDGIIGAQTLDAVSKFDASDVVRKLCGNRLAWLKRLKHWPTFGKGWARRVDDVNTNALAMIAIGPVVSTSQEAAAKGAGPEAASATISDLARSPKAWASASGLLGGLAGVMNGSGPVQWAIAAAIVIGAAFVAYKMARE